MEAGACGPTLDKLDLLGSLWRTGVEPAGGQREAQCSELSQRLGPSPVVPWLVYLASRLLGPSEAVARRTVRFADGVEKIRITGGEPLVRRDLAALVERLRPIPGIRDLALTTNGVLLAEQAEALYRAGLRRLNVHLDTLDRDRFIQITRRDELGRVLEGIEVCLRLGFHPIKINAVAVKNLVEPDIVPLARYGRERGIEIRYIEFMPLDAQGLWDPDKVLPAGEIIAMLEREICPLVEAPNRDPRAPASQYRFADGVGVHLPAVRDHAARDVHDVLDHVLEPRDETAQLGGVETAVEQQDLRRPFFHGGYYPATRTRRPVAAWGGVRALAVAREGRFPAPPALSCRRELDSR